MLRLNKLVHCLLPPHGKPRPLWHMLPMAQPFVACTLTRSITRYASFFNTVTFACEPKLPDPRLSNTLTSLVRIKK